MAHGMACANEAGERTEESAGGIIQYGVSNVFTLHTTAGCETGIPERKKRRLIKA